MSAKKSKTIFLKDLFASLCFLLLPFIAFWRNNPLLSGNQTVFFDNDFLGGFLPGWWRASQVFGNLNTMFWDPTQCAGLPFISLPYIGVFYLPKVIFYAISHVFHLEGNIVFLAEYLPVFHLSLAGIFTYIFMRSIVKVGRFGSLFSGIVFMFNGAFIHNIVYPDNVMAVSWLPLLLLCYAKSLEKKNLVWSALGGLVLAQSFLSGYPHGTILNILMLISFGFYAAFKFSKDSSVSKFVNPTVSFLVIVILGYLLAGVQLRNLFELSSQSVGMRIKMSPEQASEFLFHPFHSIYMFIPNFFGQRLVTYSYSYNYVGIFTLFLFCAAIILEYKKPLLRFFFINLLVFMVLSFGYHTFLHKIFYILIPGLDTFRRPAFIQYLVSFCFAVIAGIGLSALSETLTSLKQASIQRFVKVVFRLFIVLSFICFMWFLAVVIFILASNNRNIEYAMISINHLVLFLLFFLIGIALLWHIYKKNEGLTWRIKLAIIVFICIDLFSLIQSYDGINDRMDPRIFYAKNRAVVFLQEESFKEKSRCMLLDLPHRYNSSMYGIEQWGGYQGMAPGRYFEFSDHLINSSDPLLKKRGYNLANIKYILSTFNLNDPSYSEFKLYKHFVVQKEDKGAFVKVINRGEVMAPGESVYVYINPNCLPRAYFTGKVKVVTGKEAVFDAIGGFALNEGIAVLDKDELADSRQSFVDSLKEYPSTGSAKISKYTNSKVSIEVYSNGPGILVLSDMYYPGWNVFVDGKESKLLKVNSIFRGVFVNTGKHNVVFIYKPATMKTGLFMSLAGLILVLVIIVTRPKLL